MSRQELIKELFDNNFLGGDLIDPDVDAIADFILDREREQISKVVEPLRDIIRFNDNCGDNIDRWKMVNEFKARVQEAIAIADEILKGNV